MASLYWVGGTATWDATAGTKWATSSGGAGGASVPTAADDVFFDASSTGTCTLASGDVCRSLNCTGFTGTISHAAAVTLTIGTTTAGAGNVALKLVSGMTYTKGNADTSAITFSSTSATVQTVDVGGKTMGNTTFVGVGGSWQLTSSLILATSSTLTLTSGTLDTNGQTCDWGTFQSSNSNVRTLTLGASSVTTRAVGANSWNVNTSTNLTLNPGTSTITAIGGNNNSWFGSLTYYNVIFQAGTGSHAVSGNNIFNNLTITGTSNSGNHRIYFNGNATVNGTLTVTGVSGARVQFGGGTQGTPITVTAAAVSLSSADFSDITAAGAAIPWTGTLLGDAWGNSNITFPTPTTRYWVGTSGGTWDSVTTSVWAATSGGSSGATVPLPQDDVVFDANSITSTGKTITVNMTRMARNIDFTNITNNPTVAFSTVNSSHEIHASLTLAGTSAMTLSGNTTFDFMGRGTHTITTAGQTWDRSMSIAGFGGTYSLQDTLTMTATRTMSFSRGTFNANNMNITTGLVSSNLTSTRTINMGSGTWTLTGTGSVWNTGNFSGGTLNAGTSTIVVSDTSTSTKTISRHAGAVFNNLTITGGGTGAVIFSNATTSTVNNFTVSGPKTLTYNVTATYTHTGTVAFNGSAGNLITVGVNNVGTAATYVISNTATASYTTFQDINANSGASIWAVDNCTNNGNNHNVIFAQPKRLATGGAG